jgi:predicted nucleic acid-binding protein
MKAFLDTSVLVAAFLGDHERHQPSIDALLRYEKEEVCCGIHSLAEVYATVTRLPGAHRVSSSDAMLFLETIRERMTVIALDESGYMAAIQAAAASGATGGLVYDALLVQCAVKARAENILTWNVRHFQHASPDHTDKIRTP